MSTKTKRDLDHRDPLVPREGPEPSSIEPERYELFEQPRYVFELGRRDFFKLVGRGIVVCLVFEDSEASQPLSQGRTQRGFGSRGPSDIGAWLHIAENGQVTVYTGKVEIGQNIRTSLAQVVAEELHAPLGSVSLVMADTQLCPFDAGTFGSQTTPSMARQLRRVAAAAREVLIDLAAESIKADRASLEAVDGKIVHRETREALPFGEVTKGQKITQVIAENPVTTAIADWQVAGQSVAKVNGRAIVTGRHIYASDVKLSGMLHGRVLRPASFGATLASIETAGAEAMPDVVVVRDGNFVGVAAPTEFQATAALEAIKADWNSTSQISHRELFASPTACAPVEVPQNQIRIPRAKIGRAGWPGVVRCGHDHFTTDS